MDALLTEEWLRESGFKWEQLDRQPSKHWLLWLADACIDPVERRMFASPDDLGIELAKNDREPWWFCWMRADYAGRYSRLIHIRHVMKVSEVVAIIEAMTGRKFEAKDCFFGSFRSPESAASLRDEMDRIDRRIAQSQMERCDVDPSSRKIIER